MRETLIIWRFRFGSIHASWVHFSQETVLTTANSKTPVLPWTCRLTIPQSVLCCACLRWRCYRHCIKAVRFFEIPFRSVVRKFTAIHDGHRYARHFIVFDRILGRTTRTDVHEVRAMLERRRILYRTHSFTRQWIHV